MSPKKIGFYLVEDQVCDAAAVEQALKKQTELELLGQYKATGQIMVEGGHISSEDLSRVLNRQWVDILAATELFKSLAENLVVKIAEVAEDRAFPKNKILFRQGDPGDTYWLVISGRVRVFRHTEEGLEIPLAQLEPGAGFGEMALLTGEPRSASVATLLPTRFLVIAKNSFDAVVAATPELSIAFAKILADRLSRGNVDLARASATERAYQRFVSEYQTGPQLELVGRSPLIRKLGEQITSVAGSNRPVLITGRSGTEKLSVAWQIHRQSSQKENPFLVVDAKAVTLGRQVFFKKDIDPLQLELAQDSTLFGHRQGSLPFARNSRLGLLQVGDGGTVVIQNMEFLAASVQAKLAAFIRGGAFRPLGQGDTVRSRVRIIGCTSADLAEMSRKDRFHPGLYVLLAQQSLDIPSLRRRKKDLRLIVDYLVDHYSRLEGKALSGIDADAYNDIVAYDWPGNMEELEVVVRRAVNLAAGNRLTHEDIFIGPAAPVSGRLTFNLLKLEWFRNLFLSRNFPGGLQLAAGFFFALIFYLGFWGSRSPDHNIALILTWAIWEPLVIISTLVASRLWCGVCPVGGLASVVNRFAGLNRGVPHFIHRYGYYIGAIGLAVIIWAEVAVDMTHSPLATASLLTAITVPALIMALFFQRRSWCRYLCPLGKLVGALSSTSIIELRANYGTCSNDCTSHSCYAGGKQGESGCPMFEGPFSLRNNLDCILCGNCIKNCRNLSPRLNLRLPGQELWAGPQADRLLSFFVPILIGSQLFRSLSEIGLPARFVANGEFSAAGLLMILAGIILLVFLGIRGAETVIFRSGKDGIEETGILTGSLLLLAAAFEIGFQAGRLLGRAGGLLPTLGRQAGFDLEALAFSVSPTFIAALQVVLFFIGMLAAFSVLRRNILFVSGRGREMLPAGWRWPVLLPGVLYMYLLLAG